MSSTSTSTDTPSVVMLIAGLAALGALGAALMAVAHLGMAVPGLPGPGRMLLPVAVGFAVGAALFTVVAVAVARRAPWAWAAALVLNGMAFVSAVVPIRGMFSFVAGGVTLVAVAALVAPAGRKALLYRD